MIKTSEAMFLYSTTPKASESLKNATGALRYWTGAARFRERIKELEIALPAKPRLMPPPPWVHGRYIG